MTSLKEFSRIAATKRRQNEEKENQHVRRAQEEIRQQQLADIDRITSQIESKMRQAAQKGERGVTVLDMCDDVPNLNPGDRQYSEPLDNVVFDAVFEYCQQKGWHPEKSSSEYYGDTGIFTYLIYIPFSEE